MIIIEAALILIHYLPPCIQSLDTSACQSGPGIERSATTTAVLNKAPNPPASPATLKEQLLDDNLLRLWRTGSNYEQYLPEEDGDIDVCSCCSLVVSQRYHSMHEFIDPIIAFPSL